MATHKTLTAAIKAIDERIRSKLLRAVTTDNDDLFQRHNQAVRNWKDKPRFTRVMIVTHDMISGQVVTPDSPAADHWFWTDEGTKAHIIAAKNAPTLKFQTGYSAKTAAIAKANVGSGKASGVWRSPLVVQHPGTTARKFRATWVKQRRPIHRAAIRAAIR